MFLKLKHTTNAIYVVCQKLVQACYELTCTFPESEKQNLVFQLRSTSLDAYIHIAKAMTYKSSKKRRKLLKEAKRLLVLLDATCDAVVASGSCTREELDVAGTYLVRCYDLLEKNLS